MTYDFNDIITKIRNSDYKQIGHGSCRKVFDLNDGYVVKIAIDIRGIEQNKNENTVYQSRKSNFFAEVASVSEDYRFLVMAKAKKIKKIRTVYQFYKVNNISSLVKTNNFIDDITHHQLSKGDLVRASSWGFVNNVPVMIDYGLTHEIFDKYYSRNMLFRRRFTPLEY